jgi:phosphoribosylamine-glycine ligase
MKFVFICYYFYSYPLAYHLHDEGYEVIVGVVENKKDLKLPGDKDDETPLERRRRLSTYKGMIRKHSLEDVMKFLKSVPADERDDYFIFFDYSDMYVISEQIMAMGFKNGMFPTKFYYEMEKERDKAKDFVKKHYDRIVVEAEYPFSKAQDAIDFVEDSEDIWVLKGNGDVGAKTVVPYSSDLSHAKKMIKDALIKDGNLYEMGGFILEKKIQNCLELTPVMVFYNGEYVYSLVELENKEYGAGNIGIQKGGNQALSIRTKKNCELNAIAFPEIVYQLAKKQPGLSIYDAGLLYDGKNFYFTEFCAMRFGYDGIFSEIVMRDDGEPFVGAYFEDVINGVSPLKNKYGVSVRLFNNEGNRECLREPKDDIPIMWYPSVEDNMFLYSVKKQGDDIMTVGGMDFVGCMTGAADTLEAAVNKTYARVDKFDFEQLYYRYKGDFLATDYKTSIPNRLEAIKRFL